MAVKTTLEQLEEVQTAISALMSAQSYQFGDVRVTRADLGTLQAREERLLARYRREQNTCGRIRINMSQGC